MHLWLYYITTKEPCQAEQQEKAGYAYFPAFSTIIT